MQPPTDQLTSAPDVTDSRGASAGGLHQRIVTQRQQHLTTTARNQGEIGMCKKQPTNINKINLLRDSATAGNFLMKEGRELTAPQTSQSFGSGQSRGFGFDRADRTPERIAKAQAFWQTLQARRKNPANCCRCGKPRDGKTRQCSKCLKYQAKYRGKKFGDDEKITAAMVVAMVKQVRKEMDRMQARFKQWQKAADYRRNLHYRTNTMRKKYLKTVSHAKAMDYLADTNHAYENADEQAG